MSTPYIWDLVGNAKWGFSNYKKTVITVFIYEICMNYATYFKCTIPFNYHENPIIALFLAHITDGKTEGYRD